MSYCDCDSYSYPYRTEARKAAKEHRCYECGAKIAIGDRYEYATGKCEGSWFDARTCCRCEALREFVVAHVPCACFSHGNMLEEARNEVEEYRHELPGMGMAFGRLLIAVRRGKAGGKLVGSSEHRKVLPPSPESSARVVE